MQPILRRWFLPMVTMMKSSDQVIIVSKNYYWGCSLQKDEQPAIRFVISYINEFMSRVIVY